VLASAWRELQGNGLTLDTAGDLPSANVPDADLSEFLVLTAPQLEGSQLFDLALSVPACIDERGVGHKALELCLSSGRLERWQMAQIGIAINHITNPDAMPWCHWALTSLIKDDAQYHTFLNRHTDVVVDQLHDEMMSAYLLDPNYGRSNYTVDCFELAVRHSANPEPFQARWIEWIDDGYFDKRGSEGARLYQVLNDNWGAARFDEIVGATENHVHLLVSSSSTDDTRAGLYHLVSMVSARYLGASRVLGRTVSRVQGTGADQDRVLALIRDALEAVALYNLEPSDRHKSLVLKRYDAIHDADTTGLTGYWPAE
jgi:hypothetical protein